MSAPQPDPTADETPDPTEATEVDGPVAPNPAPADGDPEPAADPFGTDAPMTPGEQVTGGGPAGGPRGGHDGAPLPEGGVTQQGEGDVEPAPGTPATSPEGGDASPGQGGADVDDV